MNSCCLQHVALVNILLPSPLILFWQIGFIVSKVLTVKNIISSQVFLALIICFFSPMAQYSGSWLMAGVRALLWGFWVRPPAPSSRLSHLWTLGGWWEQRGGRRGIIYCSENRHVIDNHFIKVFSVCYYFYLTAMTTVYCVSSQYWARTLATLNIPNNNFTCPQTNFTFSLDDTEFISIFITKNILLIIEWILQSPRGLI